MPVLNGAKVRALRVAADLSQAALSKEICTPSMISQIESNKANPSQRVANEIAKRLNTTVDELSDTQTIQ